MKRTTLIVALLLSAILLVGCGGDKNTNSETTTTTMSTTQSTVSEKTFEKLSFELDNKYELRVDSDQSASIVFEQGAVFINFVRSDFSSVDLESMNEYYLQLTHNRMITALDADIDDEKDLEIDGIAAKQSVGISSISGSALDFIMTTVFIEETQEAYSIMYYRRPENTDYSAEYYDIIDSLKISK